MNFFSIFKGAFNMGSHGHVFSGGVNRPWMSPAEFKQWLEVFAPTLVLTVAGVTVFRDAIVRSIASSSHPALVYIILLACLLGLLLCALTLRCFQREATAIGFWKRRVLQKESMDSDEAVGLGVGRRPIVAPALEILSSQLPQGERQARFEVELAASSVALSERLGYVNYLAGALIGLGLVGTFIGLLGTLEDLGAVFGTLANTSNTNIDPTAVFAGMVQKLQDPMKAMGTAFVASLYGLLGSLLVGLCGLTVSRIGQGLIQTLRNLARSFETGVQSVPAESLAAHHDGAHWGSMVSQQQALLTRLLESQLDSQSQLQAWLAAQTQQQEASLQKMVQAQFDAQAQLQDGLIASQQQFQVFEHALKAHRQDCAEIVGHSEQALGAFKEMLSAQEAALLAQQQAMSAQDQVAQALASRMTAQEAQLSLTVEGLVERLNNDHAFMRSEVMAAIEHHQTERAGQMQAVSDSLLNLASQMAQSSQLLSQQVGPSDRCAGAS
jgi:biopolymer transport protein ExbB/TolQ